MQIKSPRREKTIFVNMNIFDENTLRPLRSGLLVRESELVGEIDAAREADIAAASAIAVAATDVNDLKDQASDRERTTLRDAEGQRDHNELADVRAALARLGVGTYGICIDCEQPIDLSRLTAVPEAARCMACQTQFESRSV